MIDIIKEIEAIHRDVRRRGEGDSELVAVVIQRTYPTDVEDLWEAITTPDRIKRWFAPVTGDLVEGGNFQVEGNAGGQILKCDRPHLLRMTYGDVSSIVEVRLTSAASEGVTLEIEHAVPITMAGSGAGALWVGPGWDGGLLVLGQYLRGDGPEDPVAAENTVERQHFLDKSSHAWAGAVAASGTAKPEEIAAALDMALKQFAPDVQTA
ncbi:MAG TPA: SRPBCC family protein [Candidatus Limnocylindrales bacterium]